MNRIPAAAAALAALAVAVPAVRPAAAQFPGECRHEAERSARVGASAAGSLEVLAGAGSLRVEGREGLTEVRVSARACASSADLLDEIDMRLERAGSGARLETFLPERLRGREYARLDLRLEVPAGMAAGIEDGSGSMALRGLGRLDVVDGSGEIEIVDVAGPVRIEDGSGEVTVRGVRGDVEIDDGSGELDVADVRGTVRIADSSGSIDVVDVEGDVLVLEDGSGSIDVARVGGRLVVERDGSGGVRFRDIAGAVDVPRRR